MFKAAGSAEKNLEQSVKLLSTCKNNTHLLVGVATIISLWRLHYFEEKGMQSFNSATVTQVKKQTSDAPDCNLKLCQHVTCPATSSGRTFRKSLGVLTACRRCLLMHLCANRRCINPPQGVKSCALDSFPFHFHWRFPVSTQWWERAATCVSRWRRNSIAGCCWQRLLQAEQQRSEATLCEVRSTRNRLEQHTATG